MPADPAAGVGRQAVVTVIGGGQVSFRNCVITLDEAGDVQAAAVSLIDPDTQMKPTPDRGRQEDGSEKEYVRPPNR